MKTLNLEGFQLHNGIVFSAAIVDSSFPQQLSL